MNVDLDTNRVNPVVAGAETLRAARRARGLTQKDLAKLLGITQARVSQWENGREEIPYRQRGSLIDIFENRGDRIGPFLERMLRRDAMLSIQTGKGDFVLKECEAIRNAYRLTRTEVEGKLHNSVYEASWKENDPIVPRLDEVVALDYERDIALADRMNADREFRVHVEIFAVDYAGYGRVLLRRNKLIRPATGEAMRRNNGVLLEDLEP